MYKFHTSTVYMCEHFGSGVSCITRLVSVGFLKSTEYGETQGRRTETGEGRMGLLGH